MVRPRFRAVGGSHMTEKRRHRRLNRRLSVRYGEHELTHTAFTTDLSTGGCFITSARLPPLHTRLHVQLLLGEGKSLFFEAEVRRHKQVPTGLTAQRAGASACAPSLPRRR